LNRVTAVLGIPTAAVLETVFSRWADLVGPTIALHTHPASLRNGVLVVTVEEPAWGSELRYRAQELVVRLEDQLGPGAPTRIEVRVRARGARAEDTSVVNSTHRNSAP